MSRPPTLLQRLIGEIGDFFAFVERSLGDELTRRSALSDLGLDPDLSLSVQLPAERLSGIRAYRDAADPDREAYLSASEDVLALVEALVTAGETLANHESATADDYLHPLLDALSLNYVRLRWPVLYWYAQPIGFVEATISKHEAARFRTAQIAAVTRDQVLIGTFKRLARLLIDPVDTTKEILAAGRDAVLPDTEEDAQILSFSTLLPIALGTAYLSQDAVEKIDALNDPATALVTNTLLGLDRVVDSPTPLADRVSERALSFSVVGTRTDPQSQDVLESTVLVTLLWVPREHDGPGFYVGFGGAQEVEAAINDSWRYRLELGSDQAFGLLLRGDRLRDTRVFGPADGRASLTIETTPTEPAAPYVIPDPRGTRLEFGRLAFAGEVSDRGPRATLTASDAALILDAGDGDGFLGAVLPAGETRVDFDLGVGLDPERGLYLEGGAGMQATVPVGRSIGPLHIQTVTLGLAPSPEGSDGDVSLELSSAFSARLGPVTATVDRLGLRVDVAFTEDRDLPTLDLAVKPPNGIGLVVESESVTGGGYLYFDPANARYAGVVQLAFGDIVFKAVGLISTRLPGGESGFSLLIIATAEGFQPRPLGYGFRLVGIGGLLGLNRTAKVDELRAGLKTRSLDSVLFPTDPVANAPRLISTLRSVFPPERDQHLFGPVGLIEWGANRIVTIDLGLVLEFPSPFRLLLLGQLAARVPSPKKALVRLNLDVLGEINFSEGTISLDAALYDSRLLKFALTGEAALRMRFRSAPQFVLSAGGLHPGFPPPSGFPSLRRLAISLSEKDNPRVRLEAYLALTAASYQYGARLDLFVKVGSFSVEGFFAFDALLDLSTAQFSASFGAAVTLKWRGRTLLGVHVDATLTGPSDARISGSAEFKVWRFSKSVSFDKRLGREPVPPVPTADPLPELTAALQDPRNWSGQLAPGSDTVVSLRETPSSDTVLVHPLSRLEVRQQVVPLNTEISRVGGATPRGDRRFTVVAAPRENGAPATPVQDHFAAGQFLDLAEDEQLVRPSFELMDSGLSLGDDAIRFGGQRDPADLVETPVEYETVVVGAEPEPVRAVTPLTLTVRELEVAAAVSAVGRAPRRRRGPARFRAGVPGPRVPRRAFALASTTTLTRLDDDDTADRELTYTQAVEARRAYLARHPDRRGAVQIVPRDELLERSA